MRLWTLDFGPWTFPLARYMHMGTVASLIEVKLRPAATTSPSPVCHCA